MTNKELMMLLLQQPEDAEVFFEYWEFFDEDSEGKVVNEEVTAVTLLDDKLIIT